GDKGDDITAAQRTAGRLEQVHNIGNILGIAASGITSVGVLDNQGVTTISSAVDTIGHGQLIVIVGIAIAVVAAIYAIVRISTGAIDALRATIVAVVIDTVI